MIDDANATQSPERLPRFRWVHLIGLATTIGLVGLTAWWLPSTFVGNLLKSLFFSDPAFHLLAVSLSCVAEGGLLFVTALALAEKLRDPRRPFEPGHYMAFQRTAAWIQSVVAIVVINMAIPASAFTSAGSREPARGEWVLKPLAYAGLAVTIGFLGWYLWLAVRGKETRAWRRAFALLAVVPILGALLSWANMISASGFGPPRSMPLHFLIQAVVALPIAIGLSYAMADDYRRSPPQHWSHWIAVVICFLGVVTSVGVHLWLAMRLANGR